MVHRGVFPLGTALLVLALAPAVPLGGQGRSEPSLQVETLLKGIEYRSLGFSRGGRSTAVTGVPGKPLVYYFGSTGGGVWKSVDAGMRWSNVSDGFFEA